MATARRTCGLRLARTPCRFPRLNEEFMEIAHYRRVALRQFRRDLVAQRKQILLGLSTVRVRRLVRHLADPLEETAAGFGRQAVVLLARLNVCEADQVPKLSSCVLVPALAQFFFQPVRFHVLRNESNEKHGDEREGGHNNPVLHLWLSPLSVAHAEYGHRMNRAL